MAQGALLKACERLWDSCSSHRRIFGLLFQKPVLNRHCLCAHAGRGTSSEEVFCRIMTTLSCPDMVKPKKSSLVPMFLPPWGYPFVLAIQGVGSSCFTSFSLAPSEPKGCGGSLHWSWGPQQCSQARAAEGTPSFHHVPTLAQESTAIPFSSPSHQKEAASNLPSLLVAPSLVAGLTACPLPRRPATAPSALR